MFVNRLVFLPDKLKIFILLKLFLIYLIVYFSYSHPPSEFEIWCNNYFPLLNDVSIEDISDEPLAKALYILSLIHI